MDSLKHIQPHYALLCFFAAGCSGVASQTPGCLSPDTTTHERKVRRCHTRRPSRAGDETGDMLESRGSTSKGPTLEENTDEQGEEYEETREGVCLEAFNLGSVCLPSILHTFSEVVLAPLNTSSKTLRLPDEQKTSLDVYILRKWCQLRCTDRGWASGLTRLPVHLVSTQH